MAVNGRRKTAALRLLLKTVIILAAAAVMAGLALFIGTFIVARGPYREAAGRLCAAMAEKDRGLAGVFFTTGEINRALEYLAPRETDTVAENFGADLSEGALRKEISGDGWKGIVVRTGAGAAASLTEKNSGRADSTASLGLEGGVDAVFIGGCLTYAGFGGEDTYCVVCCGKDGKLHIGAKTVYEITQSGYAWGIYADRVLVHGGVPQSGLGGGYASRGAIGQTADGRYVMFYAVSDGLFGTGITYDEMAAVMYEYGAVNAASLVTSGGIREGGTLTLGAVRVPDYSLLVSGGSEAESDD